MRQWYLTSLYITGLVLAVGELPQNGLRAQLIFPTEIEAPEDYANTEILMPGSPLQLQVLFVGGADLVQTTPTYGNDAGQTNAKEWHDFIGFTPDTTGESMGWVSVNHESIYRDDRIGDGGGMTVFRVDRDPITGDLIVMDQTLEDGRSGKYFNVDFVNTVGETGMNCGGISSIVDGRIWTAEEWFREDNSDINNGRFANYDRFDPAPGAFPSAVGFDENSEGSRVNQGVRDLRPWPVEAPDFPFIDGDTLHKYQNFNWMVEIDPRQAVAIRKQYNWGRQGFEGGVVSPDNKYVYLGVDATPAFFLRFEADTPGDFTQGSLSVYKHDGDPKWIEINNTDTATLLNLSDTATILGATMYNRNEWVAIDPTTGIVYWTETGRDHPAGRWRDEAEAGAAVAPHHAARAAAQGDTVTALSNDYWDYYGRILQYDPETEEVSVVIEGGPYFEESPTQENYPDKHLSNPDGLNVMTIDGEQFLIICEDLNGETYGRMPAENNRDGSGIRNRMCELYLLPLSIDSATVDDLVRITATPVGAEITGAQPTPDGKSILVNSQHPSGENPFPFNHSLTFAIHGFDNLQTTSLAPPEIEDETSFGLFPNPTLQTVHLNRTQDVALYGMNGQRLRVYRQVKQFDVSQLPAGTYFVRNAEGQVLKLVKQ
jgi:hypothetical protein